VRITRDERGLTVSMTSTKVPRLEAKAFLGHVGDLWTPVDRERGTALTLPGTGLPYARLSQILFEEDWIRPAGLQVRAEDGDEPLAIARALVRGQGKTEGLHERVVRVPKKARPRIATSEGRATLGKLAKDRVELARALRLKVLKPALCAYLQGGADDLRFDDDRADSHLDAVDDAVDTEFFPRLFEDVDLDSAEASRSFETWLFQLGRDALERAFDSLPTAAARRERAIASAEARFFGGVRKNLPNADRPSPARPETARSTREEIADDR
jgi:CRISPR system Cascade subunit CasA